MTTRSNDLPCSFDFEDARIRATVRELLAQHLRPSAWELVKHIRDVVSGASPSAIYRALSELVTDKGFTNLERSYLSSLADSGDLRQSLGGVAAPSTLVESGIDDLFRRSIFYRSSRDFREMIEFVARFRNYSPYNNMLVRLQNSRCAYYATEKDWARRFGRRITEDARPMLILAPMHPVLPVYDLDGTEGPPLPKELREFAKFEGRWDPKCLERALDNAANHYRIRIGFKALSMTLAGFATTRRTPDGWSKVRIAIHDDLDAPSRFGVLCHELAHVLCGHLGGDEDGWWLDRLGLEHHAAEVEAEATAHIVASRLGLRGSSASYVSAHLREGRPPEAVSLDMISKAAGRIERMARSTLSRREPKRSRGSGSATPL